MPSRIILIRHGEKPSRDGSIKGVNPSGGVDDNSLSVRGWQRTGALARYFSTIDAAIRPTALFAAAPGDVDASDRPALTLTELSLVLPATVLDKSFGVGQETALATKILGTPGVVLVAWEHKALHLIGDAIVGDEVTVPRRWDGTRFDLMYVFTNSGGEWAFKVSGQFLLSGDAAP